MTQVGTPMWMAPEIIQGKQYTQKADVYAFGIILWEILTRLEPYEDKEPMQIVLEVVNNNLRPYTPPELLASPLVPLMRECWSELPGGRPSFQQCVTRLEAILAEVEREGGWGETPFGMENVWGVGLGGLDRELLPSWKEREEEKQREMRAAVEEAERAEAEEYARRQKEREDERRQEEEDEAAERAAAAQHPVKKR